jgi:hypothetical protein
MEARHRHTLSHLAQKLCPAVAVACPRAAVNKAVAGVALGGARRTAALVVALREVARQAAIPALGYTHAPTCMECA